MTNDEVLLSKGSQWRTLCFSDIWTKIYRKWGKELRAYVRGRVLSRWNRVKALRLDDVREAKCNQSPLSEDSERKASERGGIRRWQTMWDPARHHCGAHPQWEREPLEHCAQSSVITRWTFLRASQATLHSTDDRGQEEAGDQEATVPLWVRNNDQVTISPYLHRWGESFRELCNLPKFPQLLRSRHGIPLQQEHVWMPKCRMKLREGTYSLKQRGTQTDRSLKTAQVRRNKNTSHQTVQERCLSPEAAVTLQSSVPYQEQETAQLEVEGYVASVGYTDIDWEPPMVTSSSKGSKERKKNSTLIPRVMKGWKNTLSNIWGRSTHLGGKHREK